jgi:hypothetical protein
MNTPTSFPELPSPAFRLCWKPLEGRYTVNKPNIGDTDVYTAEQVRACIAADRAERVPAVSEQGGWQPIATAPKDGTEVMLSNGVVVAQGHWLHEESRTTVFRDSDGRYFDHEDSDGFDGWLDWSGGMIPNPTHWRPLPNPPSPHPEEGALLLGGDEGGKAMGGA